MRLFEIEDISYSVPNFDFEWDEAQRYPELEQLGKSGWIDFAKEFGEIVDSKYLDDIGNIDLNLKGLMPSKVKRARDSFRNRKIELPIVVQIDGQNDLLGGNTRFAYLTKQGISPKVWFIKVS